MSQARAYWDRRFIEGLDHHKLQNAQLADSFMHAVADCQPMFEAISGKTIIEFGCGTGELAYRLKYFCKLVLGADLSQWAVDEANRNYKGRDIEFVSSDFLKLGKATVWFDLAVCSNILEHFTDPWAILAKMFTAANTVIVIVPWEQPVTDGYDCEGGAGHVYRFDLQEFASRYRVVEHRIYQSAGWGHSSAGEVPRQCALLLERQ